MELDRMNSSNLTPQEITKRRSQIIANQSRLLREPMPGSEIERLQGEISALLTQLPEEDRKATLQELEHLIDERQRNP